VPKSFHQKIPNPNCKHIKATQKKLSYEKAAHKILVKLTPGGSASDKERAVQQLHQVGRTVDIHSGLVPVNELVREVTSRCV
jgi:hypothetical protein